MSHIHRIKHHVRRHKENLKHHATRHKEKVKYHAHRHKERIKHHVRRRKESLPEIIFNKNLFIVFLITLAIPLTVFLASQQQNLKKEATAPAEPVVKGYIVEFNDNSLSREFKTTSDTRSREQKRAEAENRHKKNKENVLNVIGETSTDSASQVQPASSKVKGEYKNVMSGVALDISADQALKIKREVPGVKAVHPNIVVKEALNQSVPLIGIDKVWNLIDSQGVNITGRNVNIAIIDTGVDYRHPDLGASPEEQIFNSKVVGGYDFINNDADPMDDRGHGTHVAGIAAGSGVLKGVAPEARIIAYKVLDAGGSGSFASVLSGIDAAVATRLDSDPANDISVINLSLGAYCGTPYSDSCGPNDILSQAIDNASANGILSVIAAGNMGPDLGTITTPGTARSALTVGSVNKSKVISSFSSRGPVALASEILQKPDVLAPGEEICSSRMGTYSTQTCIDSVHVALNGTSMATPHVAGMAALVKQQTPSYNSSEIKYIIVQNATSLGYDANTQGKGIVDAAKSFNFNPTPTPTTNIPTPTNTPTPTPSPTPSPLKVTLSPAGDSFVRSSAPGQNFGTNANLQVDSSPNEITYIKFNLGTLAGKTIVSGKLRIKVSDNTSKTLNLRRGSAANWNESNINYNNRPGFETTIRSFTANTLNQFIELDVKSVTNLRRGGILTLGIVSTGNETGAFYSRESSTSNRPQLIVEYR